VHNSAQAYEHDKQPEKVCQPTVGNKALDGPKTNCSDDHNAQYCDQNRNDLHFHRFRFAMKTSICRLGWLFLVTIHHTFLV
jgi:hypothetical protein